MDALKRVNGHGVAATLAIVGTWLYWFGPLDRNIHLGWYLGFASLAYAAIIVVTGVRIVDHPKPEQMRRDQCLRHVGAAAGHLFFFLVLYFGWRRPPKASHDYYILTLLVALTTGVMIPFMIVIRDESREQP